jgi:hypothetical protein
MNATSLVEMGLDKPIGSMRVLQHTRASDPHGDVSLEQGQRGTIRVVFQSAGIGVVSHNHFGTDLTAPV